jgi:4-hydroxyphenylpyruvate dioxygenase
MPRTPIPRVAFDFLELWLRDLGAAERILTAQFGFEPDELEPRRDEQAVRLISGNVCVVLRQGTSAASPIFTHVAKHGDGVGDVALVCDDIEPIRERALAHGLNVSGDGTCIRVDLLGDGTILHSVRTRSLSSVPERSAGAEENRMSGVDHVTYCLPFGTIEDVARAYREVFGMDGIDVEDGGDIGNDDTGMRSMVLRSAGGFTVVLTQPISPTGWGQTQHFLQSHAGAGVQHVAIAYDDLVAAVQSLRSKGVPFLPIPQEHLDRSHQRLRDRALPWNGLRREGILVDGDATGILFQLFTSPITDGSAFFFELIHRAGATGFGAANIRGLFAAVEASMRSKQGRESA